MRFLFFCLMIISLASCRARRNAGSATNTQVTDTTTAAIPSALSDADSLLIAKNVFNKIINTDLSYQTYSSKIKFDFDDGSQNLSATAFVHIYKDSLIWVSITGPLSIEVGRMLITKDSVKIMDKLHHEAQLRDIGFLQNATGLPIDFSAMQNIITSQPFFIDTLQAFKYDQNNIILHTVYKGFVNSITTDTSSSIIKEYFIMDEKSSQLRSCLITNNSFIHINENDLPQEKNIVIHSDKEIKANLEYRDILFNEELSFSFKIPENYTIRQ